LAAGQARGTTTAASEGKRRERHLEDQNLEEKYVKNK